MAGRWVDLVRMRLGSNPSITHTITRPNISFLASKHGNLRIRDSGGTLPPIIFVCDGPNVLEHYDAVYALLSPSYRLICVELPGFGFSYPSSSFDFSMRQYADVVLHVIETLNVAPATLMFPCAWSYVAFQVAAERPALVERLIVSQCPCWEEEQVWTKRIDTGGILSTPVMGQLSLAWNPKAVADSWYHAAVPKGREPGEFVEPARKVLSEGGIFCLASLMQAWFHVKTVSFSVEQPTVVMWGESDRTHRQSNPDTVLKYLKSGKVIKYKEAGHFPELENPERLRDLLLDENIWSSLGLHKALLNESKAEQATGEEGTDNVSGQDDVSGLKSNPEQPNPLKSRL